MNPKFRSAALIGSLILLASLAHAVTPPYVNDSFKKITRAPRDVPTVFENAPVVVDETGHIVEESFPLVKPSVSVEPAPGTSVPKNGIEALPEASVRAPASTNTEASPAQPTVKVKPASTGISAATSLKWLKNGNTRFVKKSFRKDGRDPADRERLLTRANPHAIVLGCSDSRVPPELVFDQALGEIVTVRTLASQPDAGSLAAIEEAVAQGVHLLVVLGHTRCSTVEAAVKASNTFESESIEAVAKKIAGRLAASEKMAKENTKDSSLEASLNADAIAHELAESPYLKAKIASGELTVMSALYRLETGVVSFY